MSSPLQNPEFRKLFSAQIFSLIGIGVMTVSLSLSAFEFGGVSMGGPILGAILSIAASEADVARGTTLLAAYAAGLGIPFLLVAAYFPRLTGLMAWMKRHMERIERVMSLLLWTVGLLMLTGKFTDFAWWLNEQFPALQAFG